MPDNIRIAYASMDELASWMDLMASVRDGFPGLETPETMEDYRETVKKNILRGSAICALDDRLVVGVLLFSVRHNMLSQMAVHPRYRRIGVGSRLIRQMLPHLDRRRDIGVTTFREGDPKGVAARALYRSLGFQEDALVTEMNYPLQKFILRADCEPDTRR